MNKISFKLKLAKAEDVNDILILYNDLIDELDKNINYPDWTRDVYPNFNYLKEKSDKKELFLLYNQNKMVGSAVLNTDRIEDYKKVPWKIKNLDENEVLTIHTFAIKNELRGQNLGRVFLDLIEDYAKNNGFKAIRLDTIHSNKPAVHFYEKAGYDNLGELELHYDETDETRFYLFEKKLVD